MAALFLRDNMEITVQLLETALPVFLAIGLGAFCRKAKLISIEGVRSIKSLVFDLFLPVVLFNALYKTDYNLDMLLIAGVGFAAMTAALMLGFLLRRVLKFKYRALPFVIASAEAGVLGYPLYTMLAGNENLHYIATLDVGQGIFLFGILTLMLGRESGERVSARALVRNFITNKVMVAVFFGIVVGATGLGGAVAASQLGGVVGSALTFITAPTGTLMMLALGYELSFDRELIKPVLASVGLRAAVMCVLLVLSSLLVFMVLPFNKNLFIALCLFFATPASYVMPILADKLGEGRYIAATLSVHTVFTLIVFVGLSMYNAMAIV